MQQVNLYTPELRPKKEWLTAETVVVIAVCFFVLLAASVFINNYQMAEFEQQVVALENQRVITERRLDEIKSRTPRDTAGVLDAEIASLRQRVNQRIQVSDLVGSQNLGHKHGYSERMNALATTVPKDVSLTRFEFSRGASQVNLKGYARQSSSVAEMIALVSNQDSFRSAAFGKFTLVETSSQRYASENNFYFSFGFDPVFNPEDGVAGVQE